MTADETTLVQRCLEGQTDAIRLLIERFQGKVFGGLPVDEVFIYPSPMPVPTA